MEPCIPTVYRRISPYTCGVGYLANGVLLFFIFFRTPPKLRDYSKALLCNVIVDILYTTAAVFMQTHMTVESDVAFIVVTGSLVESLPVLPRYVVCWAFVVVDFTTISILALPFVYRYLTICR
ncbi:hypothetical protein AAVH_08615 [Aphelenchoides avenae]|nr:hypothetical protein AAVH_08615 [Aphelenchus avenae]